MTFEYGSPAHSSGRAANLLAGLLFAAAMVGLAILGGFDQMVVGR